MTRRPVMRSWRAEEDILAIWKFVARDSVEAANALVRQNGDKIELLAEHPELGQRLPEPHDRYRQTRVGSYLICYQVCDDSVRIIRVLHGARQWGENFCSGYLACGVSRTAVVVASGGP